MRSPRTVGMLVSAVLVAMAAYFFWPRPTSNDSETGEDTSPGPAEQEIEPSDQADGARGDAGLAAVGTRPTDDAEDIMDARLVELRRELEDAEAAGDGEKAEDIRRRISSLEGGREAIQQAIDDFDQQRD